jgi:hypothetical protein
MPVAAPEAATLGTEPSLQVTARLPSTSYSIDLTITSHLLPFGWAWQSDNAAGNRPFSAKGGAGLLSRQRRRRKPHDLQARNPDVLVGNTAYATPKLVRGVAQQA